MWKMEFYFQSNWNNSLKCPNSNSLSHCLTELFPIYQNKYWTIRQWDHLSIDQSTQHIILKIVGILTICHSFSGGILCDAMKLTCGSTSATTIGGAIYRTGHTFVLTHGVTSTVTSGSLGFKLSYKQLPCNAANVDYNGET